jgi:hypothetical protein
MTISTACSLALRSEEPVLPTRASALDFMPVHVHGFVEKANAAFDASRTTLTGVSSSLSQSALVIANYLCLAHDILAVLILWLAAAFINADVSDDRPIDVVINTIIFNVLEKFDIISSGVHSSAFWHPSAATVEQLFSSVIRADGGVLSATPNTPMQAEIWPVLPDLLANLNGPKALKDFLSPILAPMLCLLPTAAQMGIYHLYYDLLSPKPLHRVSTLQAMEDSCNRIGAQRFSALFDG